MIDNIAQELGVPEALLLGAGGLFCLALLVGLIAWAARGFEGLVIVYLKWPATLLLWWPAVLAWRLIVKPSGMWTGRALIERGKALAGKERPRRVDDPANAELEERRTVNPARMPGVRTLAHGEHFTAAGVLEAPHKVVLGQTGSAKNEADLNWEIQHQLVYGREHLVVTDVKTNAQISRIVYEHARPEDRIYVYSFHPRDPLSSSLRLFRDPDDARDLAYMLTDEQGQKDSHWNGKAADLIVAVAQALTEIRAQADPAASSPGRDEPHPYQHGWGHEITVTLNEVRDEIADRQKLAQLVQISPAVSNIADVPKEWGYIRSTASRRLGALSSPLVRRVFAGAGDTVQPDFSRTDGREIVIFRPHARSAERLSRYIYAGMDVVFRAACDGGDAGGPGCKFIIDEAASYMKLQNLPEYLDLGRASKVQVTFVLQGLNQLYAKMERDQGEAMISSTEVKVIGATSDREAAKMISDLTTPMTVHSRRPADRDELLGEWAGHERPLILPHEITQQRKGEFTVQQGPDVYKVRVPEGRFHWRQAGTPKPRRPEGIVDPDTYKVPAILAPPDPNGGGGAGGGQNAPAEPVGDRRGAVPEEDEAVGDILDDDPPGRDDDWID